MRDTEPHIRDQISFQLWPGFIEGQLCVRVMQGTTHAGQTLKYSEVDSGVWALHARYDVAAFEERWKCMVVRMMVGGAAKWWPHSSIRTP